MNRRQLGYFSRRTALLLVLFGAVLAFAVPRLNDFSDKAKVTEAWHLASESKLRLSEFYKLSARFPTTEIEMNTVTTSMFRQPDFVSAVVVEQDDEQLRLAGGYDHNFVLDGSSEEKVLAAKVLRKLVMRDEDYYD